MILTNFIKIKDILRENKKNWKALDSKLTKKI